MVSYGTRLHDLAGVPGRWGGVARAAGTWRESLSLAPESGRGNCARARVWDGGGELSQCSRGLSWSVAGRRSGLTPLLLAHPDLLPRGRPRAPRAVRLRSPPAASPGGGAFDGSCVEFGSPGLF